MSKRISPTLKSRWSLKKPLYLEKTDKRYTRHSKQLKINGFSDAETWSLDSVICEFILPRLKRFKELNIGFPGNLTFNKWNAIIDEMIFAFDWSLHHEDEQYEKLTKEEQDDKWKRCEEGMQYFSKYFRDLWW